LIAFCEILIKELPAENEKKGGGIEGPMVFLPFVRFPFCEEFEKKNDQKYIFECDLLDFCL